MPRRSSVYSLDEDLREELLAKWRSRRFTVEQLSKLTKGKVSRSALGRFLRAGDEAFDRQLKMQRVAELWCEKLGDDPNGAVGRMTERLLQVLCHDQVQKLLVEGVNIEPQIVALLARALRDLESALSMNAHRESRIRERIAKEVAAKRKVAQDRVDEIERSGGGLSAEAANAIREAIARVDVWH